jgi:SET domain-containing protein
MQSRVVVAASSINGLGVFAQRPFASGEVILCIDDSRLVDDEHPISPEDQCYCDYLEEGRTVLMQSPERHINHSCDPNTFVRTEDGIRLVVALRRIAAGDENTYDYCINGYGDTLWECHCKASRCRRTIHSDFFHLPLELQREYLPLLDEWFRKERTEDIERLQKSLSNGIPE